MTSNVGTEEHSVLVELMGLGGSTKLAVWHMSNDGLCSAGMIRGMVRSQLLKPMPRHSTITQGIPPAQVLYFVHLILKCYRLINTRLSSLSNKDMPADMRAWSPILC